MPSRVQSSQPPYLGCFAVAVGVGVLWPQERDLPAVRGSPPSTLAAGRGPAHPRVAHRGARGRQAGRTLQPRRGVGAPPCNPLPFPIVNLSNVRCHLCPPGGSDTCTALCGLVFCRPQLRHAMATPPRHTMQPPPASATKHQSSSSSSPPPSTPPAPTSTAGRLRRGVQPR
jgi:hypothetical protein